MQRQLQGIIFDCDGVIAETEDFHRQAYNRIFEEENLGYYWSKEQYARELVMLGTDKLEILARERGIEHPRQFAEAIVRKKRNVLEEIIEKNRMDGNLVARPGIKRLISEAAEEGLKIGVASITNRSAVAAIIRSVIGDSLFSNIAFIATSELVKNQKPAPDVYILAAKELGIDPGKSIAVEDTVHGMQAAQGAGLKCVVTPSEYTITNTFEGADLLVPDLGEPGNGHCVTVGTLDRLVNGIRARISREKEA